MADFPITSDELKRLAHLVEENGLSELRYEQGDLRVTLRTAAFYRQSAVPVLTTAADTSARETADEEEIDAADGNETAAGFAHSGAAVMDNRYLRVEAPIMGVYYRRPGPDEPSFVEVGDTVEVGQVVGIIEAMKVFSEVPSDIAGRVVEVPAKHGGLVQPGDPLVILEAIG